MTSIFWLVVKVIGVFIIIRLMGILSEPSKTWVPDDERYVEDPGHNDGGVFILGAIMICVVVFATPQVLGELELAGTILLAIIVNAIIPKFRKEK